MLSRYFLFFLGMPLTRAWGVFFTTSFFTTCLVAIKGGNYFFIRTIVPRSARNSPRPVSSVGHSSCDLQQGGFNQLTLIANPLIFKVGIFTQP